MGAEGSLGAGAGAGRVAAGACAGFACGEATAAAGAALATGFAAGFVLAPRVQETGRESAAIAEARTRKDRRASALYFLCIPCKYVPYMSVQVK